ncbi:heme-thiolate peroxidase [Crepidotus variabilis]|uniref:Heme-thiolate peroxidase n=1 Tax=Crepidotus variabilis TaxID=179855 RepID=A0A9P6JPH8_9AGAR|nr:heme-thiolate peroxidase [Crepidotus variabilis]
MVRISLSILSLALCGCVRRVASFPSMLDSLPPSLREIVDREHQSIGRIEKRQGQVAPPLNIPPIIVPPIPGLPSINITLPGVVTTGRKAIPDSAHPFAAPGPTDQRGGCPGLNIMANYGYINRNGITDVGELLYAQQEMLGFALDFAAFLVALGVKSSVDPTTLKMSIGTTDSRTSGPLSGLFPQVPGLFSYPAHTKYEVDGSLAYTDECFTSDHSGGHFNSTIWAINVAIAQTYGGLMNIEFNGDARYAAYQRCVSQNPTCTWQFEPQLIFYGGETFTWTSIPSTKEDGTREHATIDVVSTFIGAHDNGDGTYSHVPERLPVGSDGLWYRRSIPLTLGEVGEQGLASISRHPVQFGVNSNGVNTFLVSGTQFSPTMTVNALVCLLVATLNAQTPPTLPGQRIIDALLNAAGIRTTYGC